MKKLSSLFRAARNREPEQTVYSIREMMGELVQMKDEQWGGYAFYHEPLERKFNAEAREHYIAEANDCGREEADLLKTELEEQGLEELIKMHGFCLEFPDMPNGGGHVIFAQFTEPDKITVFRDCTKKAATLIRNEHLEDFLKGKDPEKILLAHEFFHGVEYQKRESIYTMTEKIELLRKPFSNRSRILALSEMAAMAFVKELLDLPYSPYVLDVLLVYSYNKKAASALYEEILEAAGIKERENNADNND
ncbi:MAG: hypothetical protein SOT60_06250 [Bilifractor sp.]|nr:hypothetical protein [Lachnospiraceae bacterium]MDY2837518.1 hypothetical protein [Bilifractor sp.]